MNKEELRAVYRQIRLRMSRSEVSAKSRIIGRKLINEIDWSRYETICLFQPIEKLNEVDISGLAGRLKTGQKDIFTIGQIKETFLPGQEFDLIIVPCLAFDKDNYRLGWGGGFYDKFLAGQLKAAKIGVCFQNGFVDGGLPRQSHDIKLDRVISEA